MSGEQIFFLKQQLFLMSTCIKINKHQRWLLKNQDTQETLFETSVQFFEHLWFLFKIHPMCQRFFFEDLFWSQELKKRNRYSKPRFKLIQILARKKNQSKKQFLQTLDGLRQYFIYNVFEFTTCRLFYMKKGILSEIPWQTENMMIQRGESFVKTIKKLVYHKKQFFGIMSFDRESEYQN